MSNTISIEECLGRRKSNIWACNISTFVLSSIFTHLQKYYAILYWHLLLLLCKYYSKYFALKSYVYNLQCIYIHIIHIRTLCCFCRCDDYWGGIYCDEPEVSLPTQLKDTFNRAPASQNWLTVSGGKLSSVCGAVASGMALHFSGVSVNFVILCTDCICFNSYYL